MSHPLIGSALAAAPFAGMLAFSVLGRRIGIVRLARGEDDPSKGSGACVLSDLEFPRPGLTRIDAADQIFGELRRSMR